MAQVKFVTAVKYNGVRYAAHTPFDVKDADVDALVRDGAIVIVAPVKSIDEMKVDDLKAYAEANNIDISKAQRRGDIIAAIKAAEESEDSGESEGSDDSGESEGSDE